MAFVPTIHGEYEGKYSLEIIQWNNPSVPALMGSVLVCTKTIRCINSKTLEGIDMTLSKEASEAQVKEALNLVHLALGTGAGYIHDILP